MYLAEYSPLPDLHSHFLLLLCTQTVSCMRGRTVSMHSCYYLLLATSNLYIVHGILWPAFTEDSVTSNRYSGSHKMKGTALTVFTVATRTCPVFYNAPNVLRGGWTRYCSHVATRNKIRLHVCVGMNA